MPSRQRAGKSATLDHLRSREDVVVCVPPSDLDLYAETYPWATVLPQMGHGIGDARQTLLTFARAHDTGPFWMLDDDITRAYFRTGREFVPLPLVSMIISMDNVFDSRLHHVAIAGPNFRHRAWALPPTEQDVHLRNFIRIDPACPVNYWPHLKEDLALVLDALAAGWHTWRWNEYAFDSPQMGTSMGGCRDDYDAGKLDVACEALVDRYPGVVSLRLDDKTGRLTNRVNWKAARA